MVLPGETILTGGPNTCPDCDTKLVFTVMSSMAGYYIGTYCDCGPYSRESGYYKTREDAEKALGIGSFSK